MDESFLNAVYRITQLSKTKIIALKQLIRLRLKNLGKYDHDQDVHTRLDYLAVGIKTPRLPGLAGRGVRMRGGGGSSGVTRAKPRKVGAGKGGAAANRTAAQGYISERLMTPLLRDNARRRSAQEFREFNRRNLTAAERRALRAKDKREGAKDKKEQDLDKPSTKYPGMTNRQVRDLKQSGLTRLELIRKINLRRARAGKPPIQELPKTKNLTEEELNKFISRINKYRKRQGLKPLSKKQIDTLRSIKTVPKEAPVKKEEPREKTPMENMITERINRLKKLRAAADKPPLTEKQEAKLTRELESKLNKLIQSKKVGKFTEPVWAATGNVSKADVATIVQEKLDILIKNNKAAGKKPFTASQLIRKENELTREEIKNVLAERTNNPEKGKLVQIGDRNKDEPGGRFDNSAKRQREEETERQGEVDRLYANYKKLPLAQRNNKKDKIEDTLMKKVKAVQSAGNIRAGVDASATDGGATVLVISRFTRLVLGKSKIEQIERDHREFMKSATKAEYKRVLGTETPTEGQIQSYRSNLRSGSAKTTPQALPEPRTPSPKEDAEWLKNYGQKRLTPSTAKLMGRDKLKEAYEENQRAQRILAANSQYQKETIANKYLRRSVALRAEAIKSALEKTPKETPKQFSNRVKRQEVLQTFNQDEDFSPTNPRPISITAAKLAKLYKQVQAEYEKNLRNFEVAETVFGEAQASLRAGTMTASKFKKIETIFRAQRKIVDEMKEINMLSDIERYEKGSASKQMVNDIAKALRENE